MKNRLLFAFVCVVLCSCGDDGGGGEYHYWNRYVEEYGFDKPGATIEGYWMRGSSGDNYWGFRPEDIFCFYGTINDHFWVRAYDRESKKELMDWTDEDSCKKAFVGGDTLVASVSHFLMSCVMQDGHMAFYMRDRYTAVGESDQPTIGYSDSTYLYFVNASGTVKKVLYKMEDMWEIRNWSEGHVLVEEFAGRDSLLFECYTVGGEKVYAAYWTERFRPYFEVVNTEEGIYYGTRENCFVRVNLKTGEVVWRSRSILSVIPDRRGEGTLKAADFVDKSEKDHWLCSFVYTPERQRAIDFQLRLNITTGEFELVL